ncbi:hypothetical protein PHLCEN_2v11914 [Hermanssonia centrifuga]|uniref:Uncharacterized protein n=1 Tax=Hermanssonia centrifuga TaxID=98765 RepID=A0A2R6NII3_9APHY|nr:hypothetical protein PHLCEN_2v11914 [Hermanssonia centrifuga]
MPTLSDLPPELKRLIVEWVKSLRRDESTDREYACDELTGDESTGDESTDDESTGDEPTGDESTDDESTGDEPTGDEPTGDESTGDEPTGDESTGDEPTDDGPKSCLIEPSYEHDVQFELSNLATCSLLSKEWRDCTLPYLYSTWTVTFAAEDQIKSGSRIKTLEQIYDFAKASPHICIQVKKLVLQAVDATKIFQLRNNDVRDIDAFDLVSILNLLPRLQTLSAKDIFLDVPEDEDLTRFDNLAPPSLQWLSCYSSVMGVQQHCMLGLLGLFKQVKRLDLQFLPDLGGPSRDGLFLPLRVSQVESLHIRHCPEIRFILEDLMTPEHRNVMSQVTTLELGLVCPHSLETVKKFLGIVPTRSLKELILHMDFAAHNSIQWGENVKTFFSSFNFSKLRTLQILFSVCSDMREDAWTSLGYFLSSVTPQCCPKLTTVKFDIAFYGRVYLSGTARPSEEQAQIIEDVLLRLPELETISFSPRIGKFSEVAKSIIAKLWFPRLQKKLRVHEARVDEPEHQGRRVRNRYHGPTRPPWQNVMDCIWNADFDFQIFGAIVNDIHE